LGISDTPYDMGSTIQVRLELEPDRQPIAGVLYRHALPGQPFCGWLELASAIEAARDGAVATDSALPAARGPSGSGARS